MVMVAATLTADMILLVFNNVIDVLLIILLLVLNMTFSK